MYKTSLIFLLALSAVSLSGAPVAQTSLADLLNRRSSLTDEDVRRFISGHGGTPIVDGDSAVFFVEAPAGATVAIVGDFNNWVTGPPAPAMDRLGTTRFLMQRVALDPRARVEYFVERDGQRMLDPLNPRSVVSFDGRHSEVRMPAYRPAAGTTNLAPLSGRLESFDHVSAIQSNSRRVVVYLPPGYDREPDRRYPAFWLNDGTEYVEIIDVPAIAEALMAGGRIEPVILVFVDPVNRRTEYSGNAEFRGVIAREILPVVDAKYRTIPRPDRRGIGGGSRGGRAAIDLALGHPELFGLVAAWAPAIEPITVDAFAAGRRTTARFHLTAHAYDERFRPDAVALSKTLAALGGRVILHDVPEGHQQAAWPGRVAEALSTLFPSVADRR